MSVMTTTMTIATDVEAGTGFDFAARVDELRTHPNEALRARVAEARREQQRWRLEELAATRVLDDRGALERMPDRTESTRTQKSKLEVARALESRPALAQAFHDGAVSTDQLEPLCELSTLETDAEWATRGANLAPVDLHRRVRRGQTVTLADARRRHQAREVRLWRDVFDGMSCGRWRLPDVDGALGIPIATETLSALKLNAKVRRCVVDDTGCAGTVERRRNALPADVQRHVRRRDLTCRVPGCEVSRNLQIHHTDPICDFGDTDLVHKLAAVCLAHHQLLIPHGPYRLTGDAEHPDGLTLQHRDDRARDGPEP